MIIIESGTPLLLPVSSDGCECGGHWLVFFDAWDPDTGKPIDYRVNCTRFGCDRSPSKDTYDEIELWVLDNIRIARHTADKEAELLRRWVEGAGLPGGEGDIISLDTYNFENRDWKH